MEKERINQKNASRIIQQKQNLGTNTIVDNRPYSPLSFMSDLAVQRVSEEDEGIMQGKFYSSIQRMEDEDEEPLQGKFESPVQRVSEEDEDTLQGKFDKPIQKKNETGMPDNLKAGIESLSGFSMDDVRVHYNSSKPATVQALAYTQGTDIHVAPGQEKHLPHEAWHVAQQMAGRVSPTTSINGMPVNDNEALEHEADVMGEKAVQQKRHIESCKNTGTAYLKVVQKMIGANESEESHMYYFNNRTYLRTEIDDNGPLKVYETTDPSFQIHIHIGSTVEKSVIDIKHRDGHYRLIATYNELLSCGFNIIAQILSDEHRQYIESPDNYFNKPLHERHPIGLLEMNKLMNMAKAGNPDFWAILEDLDYDSPIVESFRKAFYL